MIGRYVNSLRVLLEDLHKFRKAPTKNPKKWLILQIKLLKKFKYLEQNMRDVKLEINRLKKSLKTPGFIKSKIEATLVKKKIETEGEKIEDYKFVISSFKSIADGIAFTFISKYDIKPQNFKEAAGFISGKSGLKIELKALRYSYERGIIAILNDLTSVLKYNDLTIITPEKLVSVEMKSSQLESARTQRQKNKSEKIFEYLDTGETDALYGREGRVVRNNMEIREKSYAKQLNSLIDKTKKTGIAHKLIEPGLVYFVCRYSDNLETELDVIREDYKLKIPLIHSLNSNKFPGEGYYPLSLNLTTENYLDFLKGEFIALIVLDLNIIESLSLKRGFRSKYVEDKDWVMEFYNPDGQKALVMSYHLVGRIFSEFVSPQSLIEDGFLQYQKMLEEITIEKNDGKIEGDINNSRLS